jgi:tetratricopeptide (TPR) repeat protein
MSTQESPEPLDQIKNIEKIEPCSLILLTCDEILEIANDYDDSNKGGSKAAELYLKILDVEPNNSAALYRLGCYYFHIDKKKSEEYFLKAIDVGNVMAMCRLGNMYYYNFNQFEKSEYWLLRALENKDYFVIMDEPINEIIGSIYHSLGSLYEISDYKKSIEYYLKAIEYGDDVSLYYLGSLYLRNENYELALKYFEKRHEVDPEDENTVDQIEICKKNIRKTKRLKKMYTDIEKDNCDICMNPYLGTRSGVMVLVCGHSFHSKCLYKWIKESNNEKCPTCREELEDLEDTDTDTDIDTDIDTDTAPTGRNGLDDLDY